MDRIRAASFPLVAGLFFAALGHSDPALAQKTIAHAEACTKFGYSDGQLGTVNTCDETLTVQFMLLPDGPLLKRDLKKGEALRTGLSRAQVEGHQWMFTTCAKGYAPSLAFVPANEGQIVPSLYNCVRQ